jgi:hypothetical protein
MRWRMSGDEASVRCFVGSVVGKSEQPDKNWPFASNELDAICRKCRVPSAEEKAGESEPLPATRTDLNDARAWR